MQMPDLQTGRGTLNIINQLWIAYTNRTEQPFWQSGNTIFLKIMFDLGLLIFSFESYFLDINILFKEHLLQADLSDSEATDTSIHTISHPSLSFYTQTTG